MQDQATISTTVSSGGTINSVVETGSKITSVVTTGGIGPVGPAGPTGATGATGPAGPAGSGTGGGDASTNTSTSVAGEAVLFADSTGKLLKRSTLTGIIKQTSGVEAAAVAGTDYLLPNGNGSALTGITESQVANLTTDLAAKAPLASPALTGTPTAPTAAQGTNTTQIATTAMVHSEAVLLAPLASPALTGAPTAPTQSASDNSTKLATTAYADAAAAAAPLTLDAKLSVRAATTANGTLATAYANGQVIDGVTLATGDRILLKNQTTGSEDGIYTVAASGAPTRATDANTSAKVTPGMFTFVEEGTINADTGWVMSNTGAPTLGTTALTFVQFSSAGVILAGNGLTKTGNTLAIDTATTVDKTTTQALTNKDLTGAGNTFPTLNQNTTGSAAKLTTARNIDGQAFDGTAAITVIAPGTHAAGSKTTPVDADELPLVDSAATNTLAKLTWANLKATLKTYFDSLTTTLTNKRITKRTGTVASSATPTINTDNVDFFSITALAAAITSMTTNLSGTPTDGQTLWLAFTDNGTARAITWGASFEASTVALPTTTVVSTRLDVGFVWNTATSKWRCVAVA